MGCELVSSIKKICIVTNLFKSALIGSILTGLQMVSAADGKAFCESVRVDNTTFLMFVVNQECGLEVAAPVVV